MATKCLAAFTTCTGYLFTTEFKLASLCFKSDVMRQPDYLAVTLDRCEPSHSLQSSTQHLSVPFCNTVLAKRCFSVADPL